MAQPITTQEESALLNETFFEQLGSRDPALVKQAEDGVNEFTRTKVREDSYYNKIIPPLPITNDQLDRQVDTDKPVKIVDKEADSPAAISIPFATLPTNLYIKGKRYKVTFDRITTSRFTKDVEELRTWIMDIRQVISDNAIKDMLAEMDGKFMVAVDSALVGPGITCPTSGVVQWEQIAGGITRDTLHDAFKIMPNTPSNLEVHTCLVNHITILDVCKVVNPLESGPNMSEDIMKNGWTMSNFMGRQWIITIKKNLVPTNSMYMFSDPKFIGKNYVLEPTTMYVRREAFMLEFFAYNTLGGTIGFTSGLSRADFV